MTRGACFLLLAALSGAARSEETWEGPKLRPAPREQVFEFTHKPSFRRQAGPDGTPLKDRYEISFASKGYCDVAVAIEDPKGKIANHIVYGVLGPNAPEPLKRSSLEQTLIWNGKSDFNEYVTTPGLLLPWVPAPVLEESTV